MASNQGLLRNQKLSTEEFNVSLDNPKQCGHTKRHKLEDASLGVADSADMAGCQILGRNVPRL